MKRGRPIMTNECETTLECSMLLEAIKRRLLCLLGVLARTDLLRSLSALPGLQLVLQLHVMFPT
jgi:hypothetical protein